MDHKQIPLEESNMRRARPAVVFRNIPGAHASLHITWSPAFLSSRHTRSLFLTPSLSVWFMRCLPTLLFSLRQKADCAQPLALCCSHAPTPLPLPDVEGKDIDALGRGGERLQRKRKNSDNKISLWTERKMALQLHKYNRLIRQTMHSPSTAFCLYIFQYCAVVLSVSIYLPFGHSDNRSLYAALSHLVRFFSVCAVFPWLHLCDCSIVCRVCGWYRQ